MFDSVRCCQPFNFSPVSFACSFQDWGCVILHEIDFLLKICWSIPCLHLSWKVHSWHVMKWHWGPPATKRQIEDYQNKDRLSVCRILLLQWTPNLGRTKPSTGPHAASGLDIAVLVSSTIQTLSDIYLSDSHQSSTDIDDEMVDASNAITENIFGII